MADGKKRRATPKTEPDAVATEVSWRPRHQSPADSYTSMRAFRDAAQVARTSGEIPIVLPPGAHADPPTGDAVSTATTRLPQPGAPLFGPRGLITGPQPIVRLPVRDPSTPSLFHPTPVSPLTNPASADPPLGDQPEPLLQRSEPIKLADLRLPWLEEADAHAEMLFPPSAGIAIAVDAMTIEAAAATGTAGGASTTTPFAEVDEIARPRGRNRVVTILTYRPSRRAVSSFVGLLLLLAVLFLAAHPLIHSLASGLQPLSLSGLRASSQAAVLPTATPAYAPMVLDTDHPPPVILAESAVVMDMTNGNILYAKNPYEELPMASTTKLMTAVVALAHASPASIITITQDAADTGGAQIVLHAGEQYTLNDLLYGMLMVSGNDAAEAIADGVGGNPATFVGWMNAEAVTLGLDHTHFMNPHGLDEDGHYSSAHDLAVLGRYALSIPLIHTITTQLTYTAAANATHPAKPFSNEHQPQWWYPGADGGKPGWTPQDSFVDILAAARDGHHLLAVYMRGQNDWVTDIRSLLNWGFDDFAWVSPRAVDQQHPVPFDAAYQHFTWDAPERAITVGDRSYYPYTGFTIEGAFLTFFRANGGLAAFGYPRSMPVPLNAGQLAQQFDSANIICTLTTNACQRVPHP